MKKHNRIISGIMAVCLMGSVAVIPESIAPAVSITASAEEEYTYENLTYTFFEDGTIGITGCDKSATELIIPDKINGIDVKFICYMAFYECENLISVIIPDGVTHIIRNAFDSCENLISITIPDSVTYIGNYAFNGTPWLEEKRKENPLVIVNGILIDGRTCSGDVIIPDGVISIGGSAFSDSTLTSITISDSVKSIGSGAFSFCRNLESITIPYSVTEIESSIFSWSTVNSVTVLNPECNIDDYGFSKGEGGAGMLFVNTIYGYDNSTAQAYAEQHDCNFVSLGKAPEENTATGDMNGDGDFNISDVVTLQKYILGGSDTEITDWKQADFTGDGVLDVFDLVMMRKKLIEK